MKKEGFRRFEFGIRDGMKFYLFTIIDNLFKWGILLIILEVFFKKIPGIEFENQYLHYGAILSILALLIIFMVLSMYFYLNNPKRILRKSSKWLPSWLFFLIATISIGALTFQILKSVGISEEGNSIGIIYNQLDSVFGYNITIPESELKIYVWYVHFIIAFGMAWMMAWDLTYSYRMWNEELSRFVPYAFTLTTGFAVVFVYQIIFEDSSYNFYGISVSFIAILSFSKILGWCYGIARMREINRQKIRSDWDDALVDAVLDERITGKKAVSICMRVANNSDGENRSNAVQYLLKKGIQEGTELAINALSDKKNLNEYDRGQVALSLGRYKCIDATEPLISLLKEKDDDFRCDIAEALEELGDKRAITPLIHSLSDDDINVRIKVAEALGELGDESGLDLLLLTLQNSDADVKIAAVSALGAFNNERAIEPLIAILNDKEWESRMKAAEALGIIGSERAIEPLRNLLNDKEIEVRIMVAGSLGELGDESGLDLLLNATKNKEPEVRKEAVYALGAFNNEQARNALIQALKDPDKDVKKEAHSVLEEMGFKVS